MKALRICASAVSIAGLGLLGLVLYDATVGALAAKFFPGTESTPFLHLGGLLLALPVPLHIIFIGMIVQVKWLKPPWARLARVGIVFSGLWLGVALAAKLFMQI